MNETDQEQMFKRIVRNLSNLASDDRDSMTILLELQELAAGTNGGIKILAVHLANVLISGESDE